MLALDIENGKIRCVEGKKRKGAALVSGYFEAAFSEELSLLDESAPETLGAVLAQELARRRVRDRKCTVSLRSADLFFRRITLPKASGFRLKDMVAHALSGIMTAKDYYVDYTVEREYAVNGRKKLDVLLCGAPKSLSKAYYSMIVAAKLIPHKMDAQQNFIHRLKLENTSVNGMALRDKSILLMDAGSLVVSSELVVQGKSVFERTSNVKPPRGPMDDFYGGYDELGSFSSDGAQTGAKSRIHTGIRDEASKMLQFSLTQTIDKAVSNICLFGENAADPGLCEYLSQDLGIAAEPVRDITGIQLEQAYDGPEISKICGLCAALL